jgi:hypothetical protein
MTGAPGLSADCRDVTAGYHPCPAIVCACIGHGLQQKTTRDAAMALDRKAKGRQAVRAVIAQVLYLGTAANPLAPPFAICHAPSIIPIGG